MPRSNVKYPVKTKTTRDDNGNLVTNYRGTNVVIIYPDGKIRLNSNGWRTQTTKHRMNQFANGAIYVSQRNFDWFVTIKDYKTEYPYADNMLINPDTNTVVYK